MFNYLIIVKIISIVIVLGVIQVIAYWRYKKESMKQQFESLLGLANSFISGLLLTSSLVYLLPESYNLHLQANKEAINDFPWIFSVFCCSFALISILTQFYTYDKYFRKRIINDYLNSEKIEGYDHYYGSDYYEDTQSQFQKSNQLFHNTLQQRQNLHRYSQTMQNPKDSYLTNKLSCSITTPQYGNKGHNHIDDDHNHLVQSPYYGDYYQDPKIELNNYKPEYLFLIYCIHSFFECSAIGLQSQTLPTIMITLSIFLHKWFEVLFIQMQTKFSICKPNSSNHFLIILYTISNISGIGFGWFVENQLSDIKNAAFLSISGGTFFAISVNDMLHTEINRGNKQRLIKILLFIVSIALINLAWYAQKQISEHDQEFE
ncbi:metal cation transporter, ZIP family protein (macronuclear) [Tetrahymena thermophila SB210]|uniref:Metal cation transporter, ZIP family protein n=1 Tax=Tetrahymena thermophila (strain SB210) TaxID=312017 RepID=Q24GM3_TETTS|nr:metal cation transporter, ZIP family protein [Tetrahymena thermophila SB210]EAS06848.2 metal cation transporter, ZIP family protein [Tetrahymena thermophila SB210]|eukprot:XP_001027090.2 metal cation transporter, ZIP family protein [Tetrahymena thermophila SB210]